MLYITNDLHYGVGAFEQAMRSQRKIAGYASRMTPGMTIGVASAAMRSGLPASVIDEIIPEYFSESATLLSRVLAMYEGNDWSINLWHRQPSDRYKLATALCLPDEPLWRYARLTEDDA